MLENRSFDHMLGYLKLDGPVQVDGLTGSEWNYPACPNAEGAHVTVSKDAGDVEDLNPDPNHEFAHVTDQISSTADPVVAPRTGPAATVPFYLQPTIGGSDIDSRVSLRAYPNYRFRASDAFFGQAEYSLHVWKPLGVLLFYDAGTVGQTFANLSFAHLGKTSDSAQQSPPQGNVVLQGYLALGAGHGSTFGFNFAKLF
jgi:hypothetical protein